MKFPALILLCIATTATAAPRPKAAATPAPFTTPPALGTPSEPAKSWSADLGGRDLRFLTEAMEQGLEQIFLGELGKTHGEGDKLKAIAMLLVETQQKENEKLARLAAGKNVTLGAKEAAAQKALAGKFEKLAGVKFDKVWFDEVIALNQRAIANYEIGMKSGDADIKGFAEKALPLAKEKLYVVHKVTGNVPPPTFRNSAPTPAPK